MLRAKWSVSAFFAKGCVHITNSKQRKHHTTRYLASASIRRRKGNDPDHVWFDINIPLSLDMVAIIGNKGSGKSALADIVALAGNTHCDAKHFSFLTKERFCERNGRIAKDFEVELQWLDGSTVVKSLNDKPNVNDVERVKYIPQTYLEKVCTETEPGEESDFQTELRKVIFSHISDADRLGKNTLDDLIDYKTEELNAQLANHRREISRINAEIVRLEARATPEHSAQIEAQRRLKAKELEAHIAAKPVPVEQPNSLPAEQQAAVQTIAEDLQKEGQTLVDLEERIINQRARQKTLVERIALARKLDGKLANFEAAYQGLIQETQSDVAALSLAIDDLITVKIDRTPLATVRDGLVSEKTEVDTSLADDQAGSLPRQVAACRHRIKAIQEKLDAPNRRYQEYLEAVTLWEQQKQDIKGIADKPDTLAYFDAQLAYLRDTLPSEIKALRAQRVQAARTIHGEIASIRDVYVESFSSVQSLIENSVIIREGFKLTFESSIIDHTLQRDFFEKYINQGIAGSFYSKDKGAVRLEEIRAEFDFNKTDDTIAFVERILDDLTHDHRSAAQSRTNLADQLRKSVTPKDLNNYLWSLEYLKPEYSLRLDGKELSHLSPGERGTLLLVFYLLVDKSSNPIIVDQPEENLDNHTVFRLLIPVIKDVKKRRQLIMVTHSPNIAVVCDAEQIIHADIDRRDGNRVHYTMGSIEAPELNLHAINVLEGTRPAFDNRGSKYLPT